MARPIIDMVYDPEHERVWEEDRQNGDPNRADQMAAQYQTSPGPDGHRCGTCVYYQPHTDKLGTCQKVKGVINIDGYSHYYADANSGVIDHKETHDE